MFYAFENPQGYLVSVNLIRGIQVTQTACGLPQSLHVSTELVDNPMKNTTSWCLYEPLITANSFVGTMVKIAIARRSSPISLLLGFRKIDRQSNP